MNSVWVHAGTEVLIAQRNQDGSIVQGSQVPVVSTPVGGPVSSAANAQAFAGYTALRSAMVDATGLPAQAMAMSSHPTHPMDLAPEPAHNPVRMLPEPALGASGSDVGASRAVAGTSHAWWAADPAENAFSMQGSATRTSDTGWMPSPTPTASMYVAPPDSLRARVSTMAQVLGTFSERDVLQEASALNTQRISTFSAAQPPVAPVAEVSALVQGMQDFDPAPLPSDVANMVAPASSGASIALGTSQHNDPAASGFLALSSR